MTAFRSLRQMPWPRHSRDIYKLQPRSVTSFLSMGSCCYMYLWWLPLYQKTRKKSIQGLFTICSYMFQNLFSKATSFLNFLLLYCNHKSRLPFHIFHKWADLQHQLSSLFYICKCGKRITPRQGGPFFTFYILCKE